MHTSTTSNAATHRATLLALRSEVMANLGMKFDAIASIGRVNEEDQAQMSHDEFLHLRLNSLDYSKYRDVEAALTRLEDGAYGVCLACEEEIPAKRLKAIPYAKYCVGCQESVAEQETADDDPATLFAHFSTH